MHALAALGISLVAAVVISRIDHSLAYWITAGAIAVFIEEQLARFQIRRRVLDAIDGRIDSQILHGRVQDRLSPPLPPNTISTAVIEAQETSHDQANSISQIKARLDPEFRVMIDSDESREKKDLE